MLAKDSPCSGRALVPLTREPNRAHIAPMETRPAAFLAHLIAAAKQVPQARERRRADPAEAIAAYREAMVRISSR
jgi:hypothetical protein